LVVSYLCCLLDVAVAIVSPTFVTSVVARKILDKSQISLALYWACFSVVDTSTLFGEFEEKSVYRQLEPEEIPDWPKIIAAHFSDGEVDPTELDDFSIDCSIEAFEENLDFNNLDNVFNIWASILPLCALAEIGP